MGNKKSSLMAYMLWMPLFIIRYSHSEITSFKPHRDICSCKDLTNEVLSKFMLDYNNSIHALSINLRIGRACLNLFQT